MKIKEVLEHTIDTPIKHIAEDHLFISETLARLALKKAGAYSIYGGNAWYFDEDGDMKNLEKSIYDFVELAQEDVGTRMPYTNKVYTEEDVRDRYVEAMGTVNRCVLLERRSQNKKWGRQHHDKGGWLAILVEEVGEVAQAMQQGSASSKESDAENLYKELIQVAAVASAIAEQVLRDKRNK